jgi:hypothetical protein
MRTMLLTLLTCWSIGCAEVQIQLLVAHYRLEAMMSCH